VPETFDGLVEKTGLLQLIGFNLGAASPAGTRRSSNRKSVAVCTRCRAPPLERDARALCLLQLCRHRDRAGLEFDLSEGRFAPLGQDSARYKVIRASEVLEIA